MLLRGRLGCGLPCRHGLWKRYLDIVTMFDQQVQHEWHQGCSRRSRCTEDARRHNLGVDCSVASIHPLWPRWGGWAKQLCMTMLKEPWISCPLPVTWQTQLQSFNYRAGLKNSWATWVDILERGLENFWIQESSPEGWMKPKLSDFILLSINWVASAF